MADEVKTEKYDKTGYISYGNEIKVNHFVYDQVPDIGPLLVQGEKAIQALLKESIESEDKAFEIIGAAVNQWIKQAAFTRSCNRALEYLSIPEVQHTGNTWVKLDYDRGEKISNRVFSMSCRTWETTRYDYRKSKDIAACYVSWDLYLNTPRHGHARRIAGQRDKRFTDSADAKKYLEGRKKAYASYFTEISPPIPAKYQDAFTVHGHLLPGYTVEGISGSLMAPQEVKPISRSKKKRKRRQQAPVQPVQEAQPIQEQPPARPESSMPKLNLDAPFLREQGGPLSTQMEEMPRQKQVFLPEATPLTNAAPVPSDPVKPEKYEPVPYRQEKHSQEQPVEQAPSRMPYREQEFSFREPRSTVPSPVLKSKAQHGSKYQQKFRQPEQAVRQEAPPVASDSQTATQNDSFREPQTEQPKSRSTAQHGSTYQSKFHQESQPKQESVHSEAPPRQKSKLEFADDELPPQEKKLYQAQQKAEKTARKLERAEAHLPSRKKLRLDTQSDPETGKAKKRLKFEKEVKSQASHVKGAMPLRPVKAGANAAIGFAHQKVYQVEHENVGAQAAHKAEMIAEAGARTAYHMHKTAPYRKVERLQKKSIRANAQAAYQQVLHDNPQFQSNVFSRMAQKRKLKRKYAKKVREARKAGTTVKSTATFTEKVTTAVTHSVRRHPILWLLLALLLALMLLVFSVFSVFSNIGTSVLGGIASSSYLASEQDIDQAEVIYTEWETDLKVQIENIPQDYPGYDEYRYDLDAIGHDPLQLMAFLTAKFRDFEFSAI